MLGFSRWHESIRLAEVQVQLDAAKAERQAKLDFAARGLAFRSRVEV